MSVPSEVFSDGFRGKGLPNHGSAAHGLGLSKTVTMASVAKDSGVSQGAISSLLNDRDYGIRVSPKTRERVFKICRDLGYVPNDLRAVVRIYPELGETCLLLSDKIPGGVANPFVARLLAALLADMPRRLSSVGVVLYDEAKHYDLRTDLPSPLQHGTASKVLGVGAGNDSICRMVHERSLPAILLGHTASAAGTTSVVPDYAAAARLALGVLVRHGHEDIGIVSGPFGSREPRLEEMNRAVRDAADELGLAIKPDHVFSGNLDFDAGVSAGAHMLEHAGAPTALLCLAEWAAVGVIAAAHRRGVQVPEKFSVITFADHDGAIDSCIPMTAVVLPVAEIAAVAMREADRQIREGIPADAAKITIGVRLIERETVGPVKK